MYFNHKFNIYPKGFCSLFECNIDQFNAKLYFLLKLHRHVYYLVTYKVNKCKIMLKYQCW